ncbi:MAG TPA: rRNA maturation RNase YbeY [Candidatus Paceibacterota bacterium]
MAEGKKIFDRIAQDLLPKDYELSVVFVADKFSQNLNKKYRGYNHPAGILSFALSKNMGEIFLNPSRIKKDAKKFGMSEKQALLCMFIHGILHLKGMRHGARMESKERSLLKKYDTKHTNRR